MHESTLAPSIPRPPSERRGAEAGAGAFATTPEEFDFFAGRLAPVDLARAAPMRCADCDEPTPRTDLLFSERGRVCLHCHGEDEAASVDLSPWRQTLPALAMIGGLVCVAAVLPRVAGIVLSLGPTGAVAWVVMNLLPASVGVFLVILALRLLRDAWTNPLDEELPVLEGILRTATGALAVVASVGCTLAFPVLALWPFLG